ncbi:hypothetical protein IC232_04175 [Microvirga sp. BT688]|uniref:hypothetical protein n=1 Tax=Microvirga sp. TaxID=1873136 RepID=UPI001688D261|nr:hypothetical protein [Microvirga sp.]MBD2745890.1 hypothetical protein [Microvirga sp.]
MLPTRVSERPTGFFRSEAQECLAGAGGVVLFPEEHRSDPLSDGGSLEPDDEGLPGAV